MNPFSSHLFSTNNIHVFEPRYILILLIGILILAIKKQPKFGRQKIINLTLILSTLYLSWTFVSKGIANDHFVKTLEKQHIKYEKLIVSPTPMNSLLWHGIAKSSSGHYFATYSLLDDRTSIDFSFEESANNIIEEMKANRLVKYYLDYTQDFPLIKEDENGNVEIFAIKYAPMNYFGPPEFVYPLSFNRNELIDEKIKIDYSGKQRGPVKNYRKLFKRIRGI